MSAERLSADINYHARRSPRPVKAPHRSRSSLPVPSALSRKPIEAARSQPGRWNVRPPKAQNTLPELAARYGITASFINGFGKQHRAAPETLRLLLESFGVEAGNERQNQAALREFEMRKWREVLPPVLVAWDLQPGSVLVRLPLAIEQPAFGKLYLEDGSCKSIDLDSRNLPVTEAAEIEGRTYVARQLRLPALPYGYHHLEIIVRGRCHRCLVISAPTKSYSPRQPEKLWGIFSPVYALTSRSSWGAGNLRDFRELADWTAEQGGGVIGTLPLLAAFLDRPTCEPSPYSPASRLFWNEFYLDLEVAPEFAAPAVQKIFRSAPFQHSLAEFRHSSFIDYRAQMQSRRQVLQLMAKQLFSGDSERRRKFEQFVGGHIRVKDYAAFRAACDATRVGWHHWEERMKHGKLQASDYSETDRRYHLYAQWLAHEQMAQLTHHCRESGLRLYLDLPLGVHSDGYDLWRERDAFSERVSAGAPPDPVFTAGQDWGFAPLHPSRIRQREYSYLIEFLRQQMRHAGVLRIDHVPAVHRLFWIPKGFPPSQGAYVSYPAQELYAILGLESHRHRTILAGENLGTVPPEANEDMQRHQVRETYVVQYEQQSNPRAALRQPSPFSVASLNTHDTPPFAGHCRGLDIEDRASLGLVARKDLKRCLKQRQAQASALKQFLQRQGNLADSPDEQQLAQACMQWLAASPAETVLVNAEDLWGETEPQNVPGTSAQRPNWKRKFKLKLDTILHSPDIRSFLRRLDLARRKPRRHG